MSNEAETVQQFAVGKTHTGKNPRGKPLGFKTIITPSKEAVKRHVADMKVVIDRNRHASQEKLIDELNRVNRGWTNCHRRTAASKTFHACDHVLYLQEEPCDGKLSSTVLKPSGGGDPFA